MKCEEVLGVLDLFCEGSLDAGTAGLVEQHLAGCAACRAERHQLARTLRALKLVETVEPGPDFSARLRERIDALEAPKRAFWFAAVAAFMGRNRRVLAASCAVFVITLVSSILVLQHVTGVPEVQVAEETPAADGFLIREIAQPVGTGMDTVDVHFVTGDRPIDGLFEPDDYTFTPVIAPVSDVDPAF